MTAAKPADTASSEPEEHERRRGGTAKALAIGLGIGFLLGVVLLWSLGGNPLSDTNEVVYRDIVVTQVSEDQLCWSEDPGQRDATQQCAILTIDPALPEPQEGQEVTVGLTQLRTPDGGEYQQAVYVAPVDGEGPLEGTQPTQPAGS